MPITSTTPGRFLVTWQPADSEPITIIDTTINACYVKPITEAGLDAVNRAIADNVRLALEAQAAPVIAERQAPIEAAQAASQLALVALEG